MQKRYLSCWIRIKSKASPVRMQFQHSYITRLKSEYAIGGHLSPLIYFDESNYARLLTTEREFSKLSKKIEVVGEPSPLLSYNQWRDGADSMGEGEDGIFTLYLHTPLAILYRDIAYHYRVFNPLIEIIWDIWERANHLELLDDFPKGVFYHRDGYLLHHCQPGVGTVLSVMTLYKRDTKQVDGGVGLLIYDLGKMKKRSEKVKMAMGYMSYLLNFFTIGYRGLCMAYPYRADLWGVTVGGSDRLFPAVDLFEYYPYFYKVE